MMQGRLDLAEAGGYATADLALTDERSAFGKKRSVPFRVHYPLAGENHAIVVISHGAGGDIDTHFAPAKHLASHGYVAICVEHVGSNRGRLTAGMRLAKNLRDMTHDADEARNRPADISFAIDCAIKWNTNHVVLKKRMDTKRIAIMGHSYGAYTAMVSCGIRPALTWLKPVIPPGKGLGDSLRDPRIQCGIALSPQAPGEPFFIKESYASLAVPFLGISGTDDQQQGGGSPEQRRDAFSLWPDGQHAFVWLANAKHSDFTDSTGSPRRMMPSNTRSDVQPVTRAATLMFLNRHLKLAPGNESELSVATLRRYLRGAVDSVSVLTKPVAKPSTTSNPLANRPARRGSGVAARGPG
jgi:predicted dienelactone hydrolase